MSTIPEQLSTNFSNSSGKPDSNLSNDSNNLGGIPANEYATKEWVKEYHDGKEENLKRYIDDFYNIEKNTIEMVKIWQFYLTYSISLDIESISSKEIEAFFGDNIYNYFENTRRR